jgi:tetratricopeptide (TPR) repeat protein
MASPNASSDGSLKENLLKLSEQIVDAGEMLEDADPQTQPQRIRKASKQLRHIGDELLRLEHVCSGDDLAFTRFMLGSVCQYLGYHEKAEEAYRAALTHWPDHVGLINELFLTLIDLKKYDEALETIEKSLRVGGETPDVLQNMATTLVHLNRIPEAKTVLFNCISKFPSDADSAKLLRELDDQSKN